MHAFQHVKIRICLFFCKLLLILKVSFKIYHCLSHVVPLFTLKLHIISYSTNISIFFNPVLLMGSQDCFLFFTCINNPVINTWYTSLCVHMNIFKAYKLQGEAAYMVLLKCSPAMTLSKWSLHLAKSDLTISWDFYKSCYYMHLPDYFRLKIYSSDCWPFRPIFWEMQVNSLWLFLLAFLHSLFICNTEKDLPSLGSFFKFYNSQG